MTITSQNTSSVHIIHLWNIWNVLGKKKGEVAFPFLHNSSQSYPLAYFLHLVSRACISVVGSCSRKYWRYISQDNWLRTSLHSFFDSKSDDLIFHCIFDITGWWTSVVISYIVIITLLSKLYCSITTYCFILNLTSRWTSISTWTISIITLLSSI